MDTSQQQPRVEPKPKLWQHFRERRASATQILRALEVAEPHVDVEWVAQRLGIAVNRAKDPGWAGACKSAGKDAAIWVDNKDPDTRQRFTIAHEIGHLILHPEGIEFRDTSFQGNQLEVEANNFAAELLMPRWMVMPYVKIYGMDAKTLASIFNVSITAMEIRLAAFALGRR